MTGTLDRKLILKALGRLAELLARRGVQGEICLLGGTAMVLAFKARPSTKDIDSIFQPVQIIREMANVVQTELHLPDNWLNDAAKGFVSSCHEVAEGDLPQFENLRLTAPVPEYLLAMKCMSARIPGGSTETGDIADISFLIRHLGLTSAEQAISIVLKYYPEERIPARARYLLEDVFAEAGGAG